MNERADNRTAGAGYRRDRNAGFLMMDLLVALVVMALIAGLALPVVRIGGQAGLRSKAEEIAALLRGARNAAILSGRGGEVVIDGDGRVLRSRDPAGAIVIPRNLTMKPLPASLTAFVFTGDGRSSGGTLLIGAGSSRLAIRVNPFTAAVAIAEP